MPNYRGQVPMSHRSLMDGLGDDIDPGATIEPMGDDPFEGIDGGFYARIDSATRVSGDPQPWRWEYAVSEVQQTAQGYGGWTAVNGGRSGLARNLAEIGNGPSGTTLAPATMGNGAAIRASGRSLYRGQTSTASAIGTAIKRLSH